MNEKKNIYFSKKTLQKTKPNSSYTDEANDGGTIAPPGPVDVPLPCDIVQRTRQTHLTQPNTHVSTNKEKHRGARRSNEKSGADRGRCWLVHARDQWHWRRSGSRHNHIVIAQ